jgi:hypothetical protein
MDAPSDPLDFVWKDYPLYWAMSGPERTALVQLLDRIRPPVAIEVGTQKGGSLQVIAPRAGRVYSIDIDPAVAASLGGRFPNVEFRTGDSKTVLPALLKELEARGEELGFVLIDGDHTGPGVLADITAVLRHVPRRPLYVLLHDSHNPPCRAGMLRAGWRDCPHVHQVEIDFVGGVVMREPCPWDGPDMWGGLALAVMLPEKRAGGLVIRQSLRDAFLLLYGFSRHKRRRFRYLTYQCWLAWRHPRAFFRKAAGKLGRLLRLTGRTEDRRDGRGEGNAA